MSQTTQLHAHAPLSKWARRLIALPTLCLLAMILIISTGEMVHGQLLRLGERLFHDASNPVPYAYLRADPSRPSCDPQLDVEAEVQRQLSAGVSTDEVDVLFGNTHKDADAVRKAVTGMVEACRWRHEVYQRVVDHITPQVRAYRTFETSFFGLFHFGANNRASGLLLLMIFTIVPTTLGFHHICLRPPRFKRDFTMQSGSMALACGMLLYSSVRYLQIAQASGVPLEDPRVSQLWIILFAALFAVSVYRLVRPPTTLDQGDGSWGRAFESMPLVAMMGIASSLYFFAQGHQSGPAIYASKLMDIVGLPLALALHIWAGMLFKQSRVVDLFMNILRPWKLSPEALTYVILLLAGLPTAYAGISSVFVIAAGAIVYHEVRAVGGTSQYALAATAMSGSLGVVLRPSLLVVGIAMLNRQVTTSQLFYWGTYVFGLTSTLFFIASQLHRRQRHQKADVASPLVAIPAMLRQVVPVLPYVAVVAAIVLFFSHVLDTPFDETTAPSILPIMMLVVLAFDRKLEARKEHKAKESKTSAAPVDAKPAYAAYREKGVRASIGAATFETVQHVGAYVMLIVLTQMVGGVVERTEVMNHAPQHFPNVWLTMAFLVVAKVLLGMVMEPMGAVVLVSATLAPMAYNNGINPVHFWMMVLVAFELGYLVPPVALNQLLTRQVVGEDEIDQSDAEVAGLSFYRRYERWILPVAVMSVSLSIVAFLPLAVQHFAVFKPVLDWWR